MPVFDYSAKDEAGKNISGQIHADSSQEAAKKLQSQGFFIQRIQQHLQAPPTLHEDGLWSRISQQYPERLLEAANYYQTFASLLGAGHSVQEATFQLADHAPSRKFREISREMSAAVMAGATITSITDCFPGTFPPFARSMIQTGEKSGKLEQSMKHLADFYSKDYEITVRYRWAMYYPKFIAILIATINVTGFLAIFFTSLLNTLIKPLLANHEYILFLFSKFSMIISLLIALLIIKYAWRLIEHNLSVRIAFDRLKLSLPRFGSAIRKMITSRWCRALSMLYGAGVPLNAALETANKSGDNFYFMETVNKHSHLVNDGNPVSDVMVATGEFPDLAIDMMVIGEKSGKVETALDKVAEYMAAESTEAYGRTAFFVGVTMVAIIMITAAIIIIMLFLAFARANPYG